jgi:hypothetical protein
MTIALYACDNKPALEQIVIATIKARNFYYYYYVKATNYIPKEQEILTIGKYEKYHQTTYTKTSTV